MKLTIDRSRWLRGEGTDSSFLQRPTDQKQCCVGMYLASLGVEEEKLDGVLSAQGVKDLPEGAGWLLTSCLSSSAADELYSVNDDEDIRESERESRVAVLFKVAGIDVEFTGP